MAAGLAADHDRAAAAAPPGWRRYRLRDLERLPAGVRRHALARVPGPEKEAILAGDEAASERLLKAMFWTFVYHLDPALWDRLAAVEPAHPALLDSIEVPPGRVIDVGAGSGRLTGHLIHSAAEVIAVEPSIGLGRLLRRRWPAVEVIGAWAEALPLPDACADLTASCAAFGPDPAVLAELERITRPGAEVVLIGPRDPDWFEAHGWLRRSFPPVPAGRHDRWIDEFFGAPDPPHELFALRVAGPGSNRAAPGIGPGR